MLYGKRGMKFISSIITLSLIISLSTSNVSATSNNSINNKNIKEKLYTSKSSATLSLYSYLDGYYYDQTFNDIYFKTQIYVTSGWNWSSIPTYQWTDDFAASWSSSTQLQLYETQDAAEYYTNTTTELKYTVDHSTEAFNSQASHSGIDFKFLVGADYNVGSLTYNELYSHTALQLAYPSISIDVTGGISLGLAYQPCAQTTPHSQFFTYQQYSDEY